MSKKLHPLKFGLLLVAIGICFLIKPCPHGGEAGHSCWVHPGSNQAKPMGSKFLTHPVSPKDSTISQIQTDD